MTFVFIFLIIVVVAGVLTAAFGDSGRTKAFGGIVAVAAAVCAVAMCVATVSARSVGIEQSYGKFAGTLQPGPHLIAPWASVEEWSSRNQTIRFEANGQKLDDRDNFDYEGQLTPKLANQADAYVESTITWTIASGSDTDQQAKIKGLWQQYPSFADMRHDFIVPATVSAVSSAFDVYNPLAAIQPIAMQPAAAQPADVAPAGFIPLTEWSKRVTALLKPVYASRGIDLVTVQITRVTYDAPTEDKLKAYNQAVVDTRIAAQQVETAKQQALATAARNNSAQVPRGCEQLIRDLAALNQLQNIATGNLKCSDDSGGATPPVIVDGRPGR
jgi:hypothetical protein